MENESDLIAHENVSCHKTHQPIKYGVAMINEKFQVTEDQVMMFRRQGFFFSKVFTTEI